MFRIRPTRQDDAGKLPDIERSAGLAFLAIDSLAWIASDSVLSVAQHIDMIGRGAAWVAVDAADKPVGFLAAEPLKANLHIWEFAVQQDWQGQGIGKALLEQAARAASEWDMTALTLTTFRDVPWNAPFYERQGFRIVTEDSMTDFFLGLRAKEAALGLPVDRRCAMIRPVY